MLCCSLSALIDNRIFCVHGGLSPTISSLDQARPFVLPELICLQALPSQAGPLNCGSLIQHDSVFACRLRHSLLVASGTAIVQASLLLQDILL